MNNSSLLLKFEFKFKGLQRWTLTWPAATIIYLLLLTQKRGPLFRTFNKWLQSRPTDLAASNSLRTYVPLEELLSLSLASVAAEYCVLSTVRGALGVSSIRSTRGWISSRSSPQHEVVLANVWTDRGSEYSASHWREPSSSFLGGAPLSLLTLSAIQAASPSSHMLRLPRGQDKPRTTLNTSEKLGAHQLPKITFLSV